jgi:hypothetical protein
MLLLSLTLSTSVTKAYREVKETDSYKIINYIAFGNQSCKSSSKIFETPMSSSFLKIFSNLDISRYLVTLTLSFLRIVIV